MSIFSSTQNRRGLALLNLVFIFIFIGVLVAAGAKMYGSIVARGKINDSKGGLENQVKMITAWAVKNGRLPNSTDYQTIFGTNPLDAWGNQIVYLYDSNLTSASTGGLCGRTTTAATYSGVPVAFVLLSGGDDYKVDSPLAPGPLPAGELTGPPPQLLPSDLFRVVTLEEMKSKAGCYGPTGGRLRIVNNELPNACAGIAAYSATLFATGGVPTYTWSLLSAPSWIQLLSSTTGVLSNNARITTTPGSYTVTAQLMDSGANATVQRAYSIKVNILGACAALCEADTTCRDNCYSDLNCRNACNNDSYCHDTGCPHCVTGGSTPPPPPGSPSNPIGFTPPTDPTAVSNNWNGGTANDQGTNNTNSPSGKFNMTLTNGTLSAISVQDGTTSSCIWYQRPLSLNGKIMRAYFQFKYDTGDGFVFAMVPARGQTTISSCDENAYMGFGSGIPGTTLIGAQFQVDDRNQGAGPGSTCISTTSSACTATAPGIDDWTADVYDHNNLIAVAPTYYVRVELDTTVATNFVYRVWLTSNSAYQSAFKDLSANYSGSLPPVIAKTTSLNSTNYSDISTFFLGFTTGQHGNNKVNMVVSNLQFVLY